MIDISALLQQFSDELDVAVDAGVHEVGLAFLVHDGVVSEEFGSRDEAIPRGNSLPGFGKALDSNHPLLGLSCFFCSGISAGPQDSS